jgi:hypothetical protein
MIVCITSQKACGSDWEFVVVLIFRRQINIHAEIRAKLDVRHGLICRLGSPLTLIGKTVKTDLFQPHRLYQSWRAVVARRCSHR